MYDSWNPYVPVAVRRHQALREMLKRSKKGRPVSAVKIEGRAISKTFWGKAWCDNLERYSDYSNRLPRGRTYVRNGSVIHLEVGPGAAQALVSGSDLYDVKVAVAPLPKARWASIRTDCAGAIESLVELLQGRLSQGVMERICRPGAGLFPAPAEISFECSCPDWASMCKHVAAVLYGIGARLDQQPELLFALRRVDKQELIDSSATGLPLNGKGPAAGKTLHPAGLADLFGIELVDPSPGTSATPRPSPAPKVQALRAKPRKPAGTKARAAGNKKKGAKGRAANAGKTKRVRRGA